MEKRLILAVVISSLVLIIWSGVSKQFYPVENKRVIEKVELPVTEQQPLTRKGDPEISSLVAFTTEKFTIYFREEEAAVWEVVFKNYQDAGFYMKYAFMLEDSSLSFKKMAQDEKSISFVHLDKDKRIIKRFIFDPLKYSLSMDVSVENLSANVLDYRIPLVLGVLRSGNDAQGKFEEITVSGQEKILHPNIRKSALLNNARFVAYRDRYFALVFEAKNRDIQTKISPLNGQETEISLMDEKLVILPKQKATQEYVAYLGPQEVALINAVKPAWSAIINFGTFDFIAQLLMQLLNFLYNLVHNWGVAIILLSLAIYLILFPLSIKQMHSMRQMQELQPRIAELRVTYKDNPQRLNKEIMELYRRNKINPLGGCLPVILQIPVFFALYQVLIRTVALKGAKFLWIKDLSSPDKLISLPGTIPLIGDGINILPLLMSASMFLQQKLTAASQTSGVSSEQQKMMLILFPIVFAFIFYNMPSGLVLYWLVNNVLMLVQQVRMNRISKAVTVS